jgi:hypothetical protein
MKRDNIVIQFEEINVISFLSEMFLEEEVDCCFKHESIVDGDSSDFGLHKRGWVEDILDGTNMVDLCASPSCP